MRPGRACRWARSRPAMPPSGSDGFVFELENPERTKRYFRERPGDRRTHIHVRRAGSFSEQFALLFRSTSGTTQSKRLYAAIKHQLAMQFRDDRQGYVDAKGPFIWETIRRADPWAQVRGWDADHCVAELAEQGLGGDARVP